MFHTVYHFLSSVPSWVVAAVLASSVFVVTKLFLRCASKHKCNRPPGPWGCPIIGHLPFIGQKPYKTLMKMTKTYGNILGVKLGPEFTVVLSDLASVKEAFSKKAFAARPEGLFKFTDIYHNLLNMRGDEWQEHNRTTKRILRDLGMGKSRIEEVMQEQIARVIAEIGSYGTHEDVDTEHMFSLPIDNVIYSMICGKTAEHNDPMQKVLHDYQLYSQRYFASVSIAAYFPFLKPLLMKFHPLLKGTKEAITNMEVALRSEIGSHEKSLDENQPRDFIDYFLGEIATRKKEDNYTKNVLNGTSQWLLLGGSETSRVTMEWALLLLAKHQDIQEIVYQEIVNVIGTEKPIAWSDRESLPYTNAVIMEIQRRKTLAPLNVLRCTQADTTVGGFDVQKDTFVIANLWQIHMDPNYWENPKVFNPERFLIRHGDEIAIKPRENFIPFSYGPRMCPGERLATMQLSIMLPAVIQRYRVLPPSGGLDFSSELRIIMKPKKPFVRFLKR